MTTLRSPTQPPPVPEKNDKAHVLGGSRGATSRDLRSEKRPVKYRIPSSFIQSNFRSSETVPTTQERSTSDNQDPAQAVARELELIVTANVRTHHAMHCQTTTPTRLPHLTHVLLQSETPGAATSLHQLVHTVATNVRADVWALDLPDIFNLLYDAIPEGEVPFHSWGLFPLAKDITLASYGHPQYNNDVEEDVEGVEVEDDDAMDADIVNSALHNDQGSTAPFTANGSVFRINVDLPSQDSLHAAVDRIAASRGFSDSSAQPSDRDTWWTRDDQRKITLSKLSISRLRKIFSELLAYPAAQESNSTSSGQEASSNPAQPGNIASRPIILYLPNTQDIVKSDVGASVFRLLVQTVRQHNATPECAPVTLVGGLSPSLLTSKGLAADTASLEPQQTGSDPSSLAQIERYKRLMACFPSLSHRYLASPDFQLLHVSLVDRQPRKDQDTLHPSPPEARSYLEKQVLEKNVKNIHILLRLKGLNGQRSLALPLASPSTTSFLWYDPPDDQFTWQHVHCALELNPMASKYIWPFDLCQRVAACTVALLPSPAATQNLGEWVPHFTRALSRALEIVTLNPDVVSVTATASEQTTGKEPGSEQTSGSQSLAQRERNFSDRIRALRPTCNAYEKRLLANVVDPSTIPFRFEDVCTEAHTLQTMQLLITLPLVRPQFFSGGILGRYSHSGVLLFGPPGTGKTLLAKAVAKESGSTVLEIKASDILDKYVGEAEKNVRAVFSLARKLSPCIVFVDEVDAMLSSRRSGDVGSGTGKREMLTQFMTEWDGLTSDQTQSTKTQTSTDVQGKPKNAGVILMAATNRPFDLDDAVLRRLPRKILVDLPTEPQRLQILKLHLRDEMLAPDVSLEALAKQTHLYSGSDLKNVCIAAALTAVYETVANEVDIHRTPSPSDPVSSGDTSPEGLLDLQLLTTTPASPTAKFTIQKEHFTRALKRISPSCSDKMESVLELRKWAQLYGESKGSRRTSTWGFGLDAHEKHQSPTVTSA
ncbi:hypothetical protein IWQ62_002519 [Dispira parvispora]|uniref:AAA+ ATPase domain-containing protein n=1 Tax=Dispira parvispora TaxID=1520584 RepID=A0A9W8E7X1_9FUNG|nr:hypothetical protein IWQ62_002519 [Dispira parvispora]